MTGALPQRVRRLESDARFRPAQIQRADLSGVSDEDLDRLEVLLTRLEQGPNAEAEEEALRILNCEKGGDQPPVRC